MGFHLGRQMTQGQDDPARTLPIEPGQEMVEKGPSGHGGQDLGPVGDDAPQPGTQTSGQDDEIEIGEECRKKAKTQNGSGRDGAAP